MGASGVLWFIPGSFRDVRAVRGCAGACGGQAGCGCGGEEVLVVTDECGEVLAEDASGDGEVDSVEWAQGRVGVGGGDRADGLVDLVAGQACDECWDLGEQGGFGAAQCSG